MSEEDDKETERERNHRENKDFSELREASNQLSEDAEKLVHAVQEENPVLDYYEENPFKAIAAASGVGYLIGGGLFTPFTKRILKIGMKGLLLPIAAQQFEQITSQDLEPGQSLEDLNRGDES
jgi:ElaB/YqjD/DUF883 family membrane-anchored ribosome-binding protein